MVRIAAVRRKVEVSVMTSTNVMLIVSAIALRLVGQVAAQKLPPPGCSIEDWRFQLSDGIVTIEGVLRPGWDGNRIHIQAYDEKNYLGNVNGFITKGGSFASHLLFER
jgi:hypothetical protein